MLLTFPDILNADALREARRLLAAAPWADGRAGAGEQAAQVKNNEQLPWDCEAARSVGAMVLSALDRIPTFFSAALPKRVHTPTFNRYGGATNHYGDHIDKALRFAPHTGQRVRTDLSCTLFLSDPADYDGGELVIREPHADQRIKLPAGHMVLYPGTTVHRVEPVTRGHRLACFFWIESMVRSGEQRRLLYEFDMTILKLREQHGDSLATTELVGTYHNLLRMWADA
ncbi:MAG: Fe2+-dependent dioxygenase [Burkholderiaceae bacterium]|nr:Fe2+-dependent dioxygenase [Burkholderiaceae bacterium]